MTVNLRISDELLQEEIDRRTNELRDLNADVAMKRWELDQLCAEQRKRLVKQPVPAPPAAMEDIQHG